MRVNLTEGTVTTEEIKEEVYKDYLGGRGMGAYYMYNEVPAQTEAFSEANKLMFFNGPVIGTMAPGSNKICASFKSPLSKTYTYSLCGGHFGPELKFAGYVGLIIEGKADKPVYLWIEDDKVEIKDASAAWGHNIPDTAKILREELNTDESVKIACIGQAGETLNKMACITADRHREFGRGGGGAVMGWKNLKAIAVRGTGEVRPVQAPKLAKYVQELHKEFKENPKAIARRNYGTMEMLDGINKLGFWATKNFSEGYFEEGKDMTGPKMREDIVVNDCACYSCPVACSKVCAVKSDKYGEVHIEGPEFETATLLGSNCGISEWDDLLKASEVCDYYGMDTISAGATVSLVMECYERGIITKEDCDGLEMNFGNGEAAVALLEKMGKREGIGDLLAGDIREVAEKLGAPELAMQSKGMSLAAYDPRGCKGMALTYATSPKGAHHMVAPTMGAEIPGDRFADKGKAALVKDTQIQMALVDSEGYCATMRPVMSSAKQVKLLNMATGWDMSEEELLQVGERILNLERMYNVRDGLTRKEDKLPPRFLKEKFEKGNSAGQIISLDGMLDEYYAEMGWSVEDGKPTAEKLKELNLKLD